MKVMCIDGDWSENGVPDNSPIDPKFGETYTVNNSSQEDDGLYYSIEECDPEMWYRSTAFVPLSNIDETELVNKQTLVI